jgi:hypothetical protein
MPSNLWLSAAWPTRPVELPVTATGSGPRDVLIPQNTRNPSTSLRSARGLRAVLGRRAAMVTVDQGGHGVFGLGNCADEVTNAFLATAAMAMPLAYPVRSCVMATAPAVRGRTSTPAGTRPHPWPAPTATVPKHQAESQTGRPRLVHHHFPVAVQQRPRRDQLFRLPLPTHLNLPSTDRLRHEHDQAGTPSNQPHSPLRNDHEPQA